MQIVAVFVSDFPLHLFLRSEQKAKVEMEEGKNRRRIRPTPDGGLNTVFVSARWHAAPIDDYKASLQN